MAIEPLSSSPLIEELTRFRNDRKMLVFLLTGGERIEGAIRWFDNDAIHIVTPLREEITLMRHAVIYYRAAS